MGGREEIAQNLALGLQPAAQIQRGGTRAQMSELVGPTGDAELELVEDSAIARRAAEVWRTVGRGEVRHAGSLVASGPGGKAGRTPNVRRVKAQHTGGKP